MIRKIKLTGINGDIYRVLPDHLVAYGPRFDKNPGSDVMLSTHEYGEGIAVKESPEDIDKLLMEMP